MTDPLYSEPFPVYSPMEDVLNDKTYVVCIYILYLISIFTGGLTAIVGLIMAYALKGGAGPRAYSHYVFAIRTFWLPLVFALIGSAVLVVGIVLSIVLIGIPIVVMAAIGLCCLPIWFLVRSVIGLIAALEDRPSGRVRAWGV
jgi:uncharacterized membrane protein